ncbi:hypothetical protein [Hyalangium versicolor]|uniref:hypothetical protein n=1 Tax=Hyalangium versicolor TaxID=2861190 RepID=UPI001CCB4966|nr:hypothetical protein [Hyalangium versicolor]
MPLNPLNTSFVNDPLTFISNRDHAVGGHDDLLQAMAGTRAPTLAMGTPLWMQCRRYLEAVDAMGQISFDLKTYQKDGHRMVVLQTIPEGSRSSGWAALPAPSTNPVRGYWFPYKTLSTPQMEQLKGGGGPAGGMGYIDFPMQNPAHPFVFTGSMQGCHLVVTLSPQHPTTHFRAYHYPNAGSYVHSKNADMTFHHWPSQTGGRVCAWLDDTQYAADPPEAVDAFNFLYYENNTWRIYTQMQQRHTLRRVEDVTDRGVTVFEMLGSRVSDPIPTEPLTPYQLLRRSNQWRQAVAARA